MYAVDPYGAGVSAGSSRRSPGAVQRCFAAIALATALSSVVASGAEQSAPDAPPAPLYAMSTRIDRTGRVLAPVHVNGRGPYRFIVDTGANRSALSPRLVEDLGLSIAEGSVIEVHGVTGSASLPAAQDVTLTAGEIVISPSRVPVLAPGVLADADGILGIEGLSDARIEVDFERDRVTITRSRGQRAPDGYLVVPVSLKKGGLLRTTARIGRVRATAIIDTGAERSLGNLALRTALLARISSHNRERDATVVGATYETAAGTYFLSPKILIGDAELSHLEITFSDLHVFRIWDLEHEPAIVIGMDLLGTSKQFAVDYRRREIQIRP
jgi:predicted aspartyl protease